MAQRSERRRGNRSSKKSKAQKRRSRASTASKKMAKSQSGAAGLQPTYSDIGDEHRPTPIPRNDHLPMRVIVCSMFSRVVEHVFDAGTGTARFLEKPCVQNLAVVVSPVGRITVELAFFVGIPLITTAAVAYLLGQIDMHHRTGLTALVGTSVGAIGGWWRTKRRLTETLSNRADVVGTPK